MGLGSGLLGLGLGLGLGLLPTVRLSQLAMICTMFCTSSACRWETGTPYISPIYLPDISPISPQVAELGCLFADGALCLEAEVLL